MATFLKQGSAGTDVRNLQEALNFIIKSAPPWEKYGAPLQADGLFGPKTKDCVIKFQTANKLTADGIVGPITANALMAKVLAGIALTNA